MATSVVLSPYSSPTMEKPSFLRREPDLSRKRRLVNREIESAFSHTSKRCRSVDENDENDRRKLFSRREVESIINIKLREQRAYFEREMQKQQAEMNSRMEAHMKKQIERLMGNAVLEDPNRSFSSRPSYIA